MNIKLVTVAVGNAIQGIFFSALLLGMLFIKKPYCKNFIVTTYCNHSIEEIRHPLRF